MKFSELNLEASLNSAINRLNYDECTPIQEQAIPPVIDGKDVAGLAQTGTGKTAAFLIPIMERILRSRPVADESDTEALNLHQTRGYKDWKAQNFILILVPTRELAEQVYENITKLGEEAGLKGFAIYGGTGYEKQKEALKNGVQFIVATPGRLIDLYKEHLVDLKQVRAIIFDEADRMFDMGFKDDMKFILQRVPRERQFLVFSATLNFDVLNTAYQFGSEPIEVNISRDQAKAENVKDQIFHVGSDEKPQQLLSILKVHNPKQAIIFTNFKMSVEKIARFLVANDIPAMAISSLLTQVQRNRVIEQFKAENNMNILVATDVAARGLDIKGVDMVINYELPMDSESYVHRIGRTGRAGTTGQAFSLVGDKDIESLARIEDYLKHKIDVGYLENDQLIKDFKSMQEFYSGGGGRHQGDKPRGPRQDRGERGDRGGSRGGDRSDRGGDRGDRRGPRQARPAGASAGNHQANGSDSRRPERNFRDRNDGPKRDQASRGPRPDGARRPDDNRGAHAKRHPPRAGQGANGSFDAKNRGPRKPQQHARKAVPAQKSVTQKITGFFKRLFS